MPATDAPDLDSREWWQAEADRLTGTFTVREIGTCAVKGCKSTVAADVTYLRRYSVISLIGQAGRDLASKVTVVGSRPSTPCHHGSTRWAAVRGTYNAGVKCTARCIDARRADCECSCAGKNHGAGHMSGGLF